MYNVEHRVAKPCATSCLTLCNLVEKTPCEKKLRETPCEKTTHKTLCNLVRKQTP
jgi:hypothetical protein